MACADFGARNPLDWFLARNLLGCAFNDSRNPLDSWSLARLVPDSRNLLRYVFNGSARGT